MGSPLPGYLFELPEWSSFVPDLLGVVYLAIFVVALYASFRQYGRHREDGHASQRQLAVDYWKDEPSSPLSPSTHLIQKGSGG